MRMFWEDCKFAPSSLALGLVPTSAFLFFSSPYPHPVQDLTLSFLTVVFQSSQWEFSQGMYQPWHLTSKTHSLLGTLYCCCFYYSHYYSTLLCQVFTSILKKKKNPKVLPLLISFPCAQQLYFPECLKCSHAGPAETSDMRAQENIVLLAIF